MTPFTRTPRRNVNPTAFSVFAGLLLVLALLLYLKPYTGIRHDSILYLGQALLRNHPETFGHDLFFAYGSQAQFTIYPQLLAFFLKHFDVANLFLGMTLVGGLFFIAASYFLICQLFPRRARLWTLLALLIMPTMYGGNNVFSYAENFPTARTLAEPLVLLAIAAFIRKRWLIAFLVWLTAALLHPLQALPALIIGWAWLIGEDKRWLHLLWLPAIVAVLGLFGIAPFSILRTQYDEQWLTWSQTLTHVFATLWSFNDWCYLVTDVFLLWVLVRYTRGVMRQLCKALLLGSAIGMSASLLLADMLHMVWPTGLQLWRVLWLLHWTAMASVPYLLYRLWRKGATERPRWLLLLAITLIGTAAGQGTVPWATLIMIPLFVIWPRVSESISPAIKRILMGALVLVLLLALLKHFIISYKRFSAYDFDWQTFRIELAILSYPLILASMIAAGIWWWHRGKTAIRAGITIFLILWLAYATYYWDRRNNWTRVIEEARTSESTFGVKISPGAQVYWEGELLAPWLILRRPSFFNGHQTAGMLFNRGTAYEANIRENVLGIIELQSQICGVMNTLKGSNGSCQLDENAVKDVCLESKGRLDYLVLRNLLPGKSVASWHALSEKNKLPVVYHLYQCKDFPPFASRMTNKAARRN